jgi:hypothetical protein
MLPSNQNFAFVVCFSHIWAYPETERETTFNGKCEFKNRFFSNNFFPSSAVSKVTKFLLKPLNHSHFKNNQYIPWIS